MRLNRLWLAVVSLAVVGMGVAVVLRGPLDVRRMVAEALGQELRHQIVALVSLPTNPPPETADFAPIAYSDVPPYAINVFLEQEVEEWKIRESLRLARDAGFHFVKQQLPWGAIERPAKGKFEDPNAPNHDAWAQYDLIVRLAEEYGLEVIFRIDTSPEWARPNNPKLETPPVRFEDFGDFVATVVARYRGRVRYYQIWNEPNLAFEWGGEAPDAARYVDLLRIASQRAKEVDPNVVIISASLAPTIEHSERAVGDITYLQQMYDAGAAPYFDILGVNAYGLRHGPDDRRLGLTADMNFSRPVLVRSIMVRNGDREKPIWASEIGWVALPPDFPEEPRYGRVSRDTQAAYTVRAYRRAQDEWPWMGVMALWHLRLVHPGDRVQQHYYFNVVDDNFRPYPVYEAVRALIAERPALTRGYRKPNHWAIVSDGPFSVTEAPTASLGTLWVGQPGAVLRFQFEGSVLRIVTDPDGGSGRLLVTIDGSPASQPYLHRWSDGSGLSSGGIAGDGLVTATVFDNRLQGYPSRHDVELRVVDGPVAIDGIVVEGPTPYQTFMAAGLRAAVGALVAAGWTIRQVRRRWRRRWSSSSDDGRVAPVVVSVEDAGSRERAR